MGNSMHFNSDDIAFKQTIIVFKTDMLSFYWCMLHAFRIKLAIMLQHDASCVLYMYKTMHPFDFNGNWKLNEKKKPFKWLVDLITNKYK